MASPVTSTDYKSSSSDNKQRISGGKFGNPMGGTPWIEMDEDFVSYDSVEDKVFVNKAGSCKVALDTPLRSFSLKSPTDDSDISFADFIAMLQSQGSFMDKDFFTIFYSLGRRTQVLRDAYVLALRAQAEAQAVYDLEQSEASFATLNAAIAATEAARGEM